MFQLTMEQNTLPDDLRVSVWRLLLEVPSDLDEDALTASITDCEMDLPPRNQRTIRVDAERTRADVAAFVTPEMNLRIQKILTFYCKEGWRCRFPRKGVHRTAPAAAAAPPVPYKQGLNELLAVFLCLGGAVGALSDGLILALLARFVSVFAPRIYASEDPDATSLQCSLRLFRLLMQYHLPGVSLLLDQYDVAPELYSTPWLLCLMARGNSMATVLPLWDFLIACARRPGPALFHCVALAFLASLHPRLVEVSGGPDSSTDLPMVLTRATFFGPEHVRSVAAQALDYYAETPLSFRRLIAGVCYGSLGDGSRERDSSSGAAAAAGGSGSARDRLAIDEALSIPISSALLSRLDNRLAVKISVAELLVGAGSRLAGSPVATDGCETPHSPGGTSAFCPGFGTDAEEDALAAEVSAAAAAAASGAASARGGVHQPPSAKKPSGGFSSSSSSSSSSSAPSKWRAEPAGFERLLHQRTHLDVPPRYFLLDCRPAPEFEYGGHLPTAFHLDPSLLSDPEALGRLMDGFSGLKGVHFAILGSGNLSQWYHAPQLPPDLAAAAAEAVAAAAAAGAASPTPSPRTSVTVAGGSSGSLTRRPSGAAFIRKRGSSAGSDAHVTGSSGTSGSSGSAAGDSGFDEAAAIRSGLAPISADEEDDYASADATRLFLLYFLQKGFLRVSEVEGGFTALHQHQAHFLSSVLVNHDPALCMVCSGGAAADKYAAAQAAEAASAAGFGAGSAASVSAGASSKARRGTGGAAGTTNGKRSSTTLASGSSSASASGRGVRSAPSGHGHGQDDADEEDDERSARLLGAAGSVFAAAASLLKSPPPGAAGKSSGRDRDRQVSASASSGSLESTVGRSDAAHHVAAGDDDDDDDVEITLFDPGHGSPAGGTAKKQLPPKASSKGAAGAISVAAPTKLESQKLATAAEKPAATAAKREVSPPADGTGPDEAAARVPAPVAAREPQHAHSGAAETPDGLRSRRDTGTGMAAATHTAGSTVTRDLPPGWVHLHPLHRCDLVEEEEELAVDDFGSRTVPALREWVFLEQQLDELERSADLAARSKAAAAAGGGSVTTSKLRGNGTAAGASPSAGADAASAARPRTGSGTASPAASAARRGLGLDGSGDSPRAPACAPADPTARRGSGLASVSASATAAAATKPPSVGSIKGPGIQANASSSVGRTVANASSGNAHASTVRGIVPARGSAPPSPGASAAATLDQLGAPVNFDETLAAGAASAARSAKTAAGIAGRALKSIFGPPPPTTAIPSLPRSSLASAGAHNSGAGSTHAARRIHPDAGTGAGDDDDDEGGLEAMEARAEAMLRQRGLSSGTASARASIASVGVGVGGSGAASLAAPSPGYGTGSSPGLPRSSSSGAGAGAFVLGRTPGFDAYLNARGSVSGPSASGTGTGTGSGSTGGISPGSSDSAAAAARRASMAASVISAGAPLPSPASGARGSAAGRLSAPGGAKV